MSSFLARKNLRLLGGRGERISDDYAALIGGSDSGICVGIDSDSKKASENRDTRQIDEITGLIGLAEMLRQDDVFQKEKHGCEGRDYEHSDLVAVPILDVGVEALLDIRQQGVIGINLKHEVAARYVNGPVFRAIFHASCAVEIDDSILQREIIACNAIGCH